MTWTVTYKISSDRILSIQSAKISLSLLLCAYSFTNTLKCNCWNAGFISVHLFRGWNTFKQQQILLLITVVVVAVVAVVVVILRMIVIHVSLVDCLWCHACESLRSRVHYGKNSHYGSPARHVLIGTNTEGRAAETCRTWHIKTHFMSDFISHYLKTFTVIVTLLLEGVNS